ncbi:nucleoside diphosphate kinase [Ligilactobacillus salitolerans]|uniref:Nucleoside diphosphate kinase n=1 Tax=Ligilactobacillus salitolerans TaxID=1808352 RepID=A0A401IVU4_9LACO|nr:nucleoside-diphosphate kinase [Ligilactobacillus salitolerans]GBG95607.1 nucleoside diphosphate kinase [Ligilactobacillus salitolerans]
MTEERTLILIKPDGVKAHHIGQIITRIENKGYSIDGLKLTMATPELLKKHYVDKVNKPYFSEIETYMLEGPIVAIIASGSRIIKGIHVLAGDTSPNQAAPGTIRGDFGRMFDDGILRNVVHSSDNPQNAENEIKLWFPELSQTEQLKESIK